MDTILLTDTVKSTNRSVSTESENYGLQSSLSNNSISTDFSLPDNHPTAPIKKRIRNNVRSTRVNSAYLPTSRFSRYKTALASFIPLRTSSTGTKELPVDSVGCFSNSSFNWTRKFLITRSMQQQYNTLPSHIENLNRESNFLLPKRTYSDSSETNSRRLLGIYKDEIETRGEKATSMVHVFWRFGRTRIIIASLMRILSTFISLLGLVVLIKMTIESMESELQSEATPKNFTIEPGMELQNEVNIEQLNRIGYSIGFIMCYFLANFFKSMTNWLDLRTSIRLRTAVLSSVYKKVMKSCIVNNVAPHQIMTFANEESDIIFSLIQNGSAIFSVLAGFILSIVSSIVLLGAPGMWPLIAVIGLFVLTIILDKISTHHFRIFLAYSAKKLTIVEDFCTNFRNIKVLQLEPLYLNNFFDFVSQQYASLKWAEIFSTRFSGGMTSTILIGGLYLIWCDVDIETDSSEVLVLVLIFAHIVKELMLEYCSNIESILQGKAMLDKLKHCYNLSTPNLLKLRPNSENLVIQIRSAEFVWKPEGEQFSLFIQDFDVAKHQIVGITGSSGAGKTTLLYSILRCTQLRKGTINQKGKLAFFPEKPFILAGSLKENILMGEPFDSTNYYNAINCMLLNEDVINVAGIDDMPINSLDLDSDKLERIVLARAVYCRREIIMLDDPLNKAKDKQFAVHLFKKLMLVLMQSNKTVIVVSQNNSILEQCQRIYRLENGQVYKEADFTEFLHVPSHVDMIRKHDVLNMCAGNEDKILGSNVDGINVIKPDKIKTTRRSFQQETESNENIANVAPFHKIRLRNLNVCDYIFLGILSLISASLYFAPPLGLILIVQKEEIEPWLSSICLGIILAILISDNIAKIYLANISANRNKSYQNKLFKLLIGSSLNFLNTSLVSDILILFADTISSSFLSYGACIQETFCVLVAAALLILSNYWAVFVVTALIFACFIIIGHFKYTIEHLYIHENESRKRIFATLTNRVRGRAVIQSFDNLSELSKVYYTNVEENSTSIFLIKSLQFHAEFLINLISGIGLIGVYLILLLVPSTQLSIHHFIIASLSYFVLAHSLNNIVRNSLLLIISHKKVELLQRDITKIETLDVESKETDDFTHGVSISFKDLSLKISTNPLLQINKLNIQAGETVGLTGRGSNMIVPLLYRIILPSKGTILLNQRIISHIEESILKSSLGTITSDPVTNKVTIFEFLNPNEDIPKYEVIDALKEVKLWEFISKLPKDMDEQMHELTATQHQLLCLAKVCLKQPAVIIIENIHPTIQEIVDFTLKRKFAEKTTIIIGGHESQFRLCDRVIVT